MSSVHGATVLDDAVQRVYFGFRVFGDWRQIQDHWKTHGFSDLTKTEPLQLESLQVQNKNGWHF